jgi:hypothetical protein
LHARLKWAASLGALALAAGAAALAPTIVASKPVAAAQTDREITSMRRLTEAQYRQALTDVFGPGLKMTGSFEPEARLDGLQAIGSRKLTISPTGFEQYYALAKTTAEQILAEPRRDAIMPCKPADLAAADPVCTAQFVRLHGRKLFRRAVSESKVRDYVALADKVGAGPGGYYAGLQLTLTAMLVSPDFLFRMETVEGDPARKGARRLDGYSKAQRLSYLLWNTAPDEALLKAAESGALHTPAGLRVEVERMMASPRLETGVRAFFSDWMQLDLFDVVTKDAAIYPKYSQAVAKSAREQTLRTVVDLLLVRKQDYRDIFTTRQTFMDRSLSAIYQAPFTFEQEWAPYTFDEKSDRAGVLTQVTFLALHSHPGRSSPTKRGIALYEIFMCDPTPNAPANVDFSIVNDLDNPEFKTSRARLLAHATDEACSGCHKKSDSIGLTLERFDSVGQPRTTENGAPIDTSAEFGDKQVANAGELMKLLRNDPEAPRCLVRTLFNYGTGDALKPAQANAMTKIEQTFAASGYKLPALLRALASDPAFLSPPQTQAKPLDRGRSTIARAANAAQGGSL